MESEFELIMTKLADIDTWFLAHPFVSFPRSGFNDAFVEEERKKYSFSRLLYSRSETKNVLIRFYNFYFNGLVEVEDNVVSTVLDMIALSRTKDRFIWSADASAEEGFYPVNKSTSIELKNIQSASKYSPMCNFYKHVNEFIMSIEVTKQPSTGENNLLRLSGFLALTLLRFVVKDLNFMKNLFSKKQYTALLSTVLQLDVYKYFYPPCEKCLEKCTLELSKNNQSISKMFIILCDEYKNALKSDSVNSKIVSEYLSESVLTQTKMNGLGLIQMLDKVCKITNKTWTQIKAETSIGLTETSWKEIDEFYKTQMKEGDEQICYPWARIIDDSFFLRIAPKENQHLATIFAAVIEKVDGPGIWCSAWTKKKTIFESCKKIGYELFDRSCSRLQ